MPLLQSPPRWLFVPLPLDIPPDGWMKSCWWAPMLTWKRRFISSAFSSCYLAILVIEPKEKTENSFSTHDRSWTMKEWITQFLVNEEKARHHIQNKIRAITFPVTALADEISITLQQHFRTSFLSSLAEENYELCLTWANFPFLALLLLLHCKKKEERRTWHTHTEIMRQSIVIKPVRSTTAQKSPTWFKRVMLSRHF